MKFIEDNYNTNLTVMENAKQLNFSSKTIGKYVKSSTKELHKKQRSNRFEEFMQFYMLADNKDKSIRELSKLSGISKSQVQRYLTKLRNL